MEYNFEDLPEGILVEITPTNEIDADIRSGRGTRDGMVRKLTSSYTMNALRVIHRMALQTASMIYSLREKHDQKDLTNVEIEFGLNFTADLEAYIAKVGTNSTVKVKLTWQPSDRQDQTSQEE
jgi:uncharacterized protein YfiM (DUF2279 family)